MNIQQILQSLVLELEADRFRNEGMIIGVKLAWDKLRTEAEAEGKLKDATNAEETASVENDTRSTESGSPTSGT